MAAIRFTDNVEGSSEILRSADTKEARRLFDYAKRVATADVTIDLLAQYRRLDRHVVVFEERKPTMAGMTRTR